MQTKLYILLICIILGKEVIHMPSVDSTCFCSLLFPIINLNKSWNLAYINPQTIKMPNFISFSNKFIDPKSSLIIQIKWDIFLQFLALRSFKRQCFFCCFVFFAFLGKKFILGVESSTECFWPFQSWKAKVCQAINVVLR